MKNSKNRYFAPKRQASNQNTKESFAAPSNKPSPQRLIVVLGMHRSGTSAMTRGLQVMGVDLGDRMMPPAAGNNAKGFWEDIDLNALNIEMLQAINSDWCHVSPIQPVGVAILRKKGYLFRAVELIRQKLSSSPIFAFKDPRVAKLLPFWKEVFNHCQFDVSYLLTFRHPLSVAQSLAKRDSFQAEQSYLMWADHVLTSLIGSAGNQRVLVDYDCLMQSPEHELNRIAKCLKLEIDPGQLEYYKTEFLDQGLRHTAYRPNDLSLDDACPILVQKIYDVLLEVALGNLPIDEAELQNKALEWASEFGRIELPLLLADKFFGQIGRLSQTMNERDGHIVGLHQAVGERDGHIAGLHQAVGERDGQIAGLHQAVGERDGQIAGLHQAVGERNEQIAGLHQAVGERNEQIAGLHQAVGERNEQIAGLHQAVGAMKESASWRITRPLRFIGQPLKPAVKLYRIALKSIQMGGGLLGTTGLAFKVLRKEGISGITWRLSNARALLANDTRNSPLRLSEKYQSAPVTDGRHDPSSSEPCEDYVALSTSAPLTKSKVRLICFYLPQFHSIPENDAWWGNGFTEWTNVQPAKPQFVGHYQPHVPAELGYYNLLDPEMQRRQIELAKLYGIGGFCFYFYWFGGERLLETPIENYLTDNTLDLPFCLCWANENWSRRWDGLDSEILMAQNYSAEDDLAFIAHVSKYMRDPRYIRIHDKPLLLVYRPSLLPSAKATAKCWRRWCLNNGIGEIYLAYTQSFEAADPAIYGFDAAIEFPPNNSAPPDITQSMTKINAEFEGIVYDWQVFVERSRHYKREKYKLFRSVCPSWDNTARRKNKGAVFFNNTPKHYEEWLKNAINETCSCFDNPEEHLVFANAWNEWAEGAHLEPDQRYGYAWLQATRNALLQTETEPKRRKIIVVSHDAHPHGAQYLALYLAKTLSSDLGFEVDLVLLGDGILSSEYSKWATVHNMSGVDARGVEAQALARRLARSGHQAAIVNTTVSGLFLGTLETAGIRCVALVHELSGVIETNNLQAHANEIINKATAVVFPAQQVADSFLNIVHAPTDNITIRHQGLYKKNTFRGANEVARKQLRETLSLEEHAKIVLSVGYADHRKGVDNFIEIGIKVLARNPDIFFVWVGHWDIKMQAIVERRIAESKLEKRFLFVGRQDNTDMYYAGADVYALTSREDPFPSVVMESLEVSIPVVGFKGAGGFDTLLEKGCGLLIEKDDTSAFANALLELLNSPKKSLVLGEKGCSIIKESFSFRHYLYDLLDLVGIPQKRLSVIVPNYNYARYIKARLDSIIHQTTPIFELIILDDASTDNSVSDITTWLSDTQTEGRLVVNKSNSGNVFKQWAKGISLATGDYIWIAEADDLCLPNLLEILLEPFTDSGVVLSYCDSEQIDEHGRTIGADYHHYLKDICGIRWRRQYVENGVDEIKTSLAIKNTIPNVSGVLFRRDALSEVFASDLEKIIANRRAGDWLVYLNILEKGKIAFNPCPANIHRRHGGSVIGAESGRGLVNEICEVQHIVASRYELPENIVEQANLYIEQLRKRFNLEE